MRWRSASVVTIAMVAIAGCGAVPADEARSPLTSVAASAVPMIATSAPPATTTTVLTSASSVEATDGAATSAAVVGTTSAPAAPTPSGGLTVRCPKRIEPFVGSVAGADDADPLAAEADGRIVDAYGEAHRDEFGGIDIGRGTSPPQIELGFTAHVDEHRAALTAMLAHPEWYVIVQVPHSVAEIDEIKAAIARDATDLRILGWGGSGHVVGVDLGPGQEALAATYFARWGDALQITIVNLPYVPDGCGAQSVQAACPDIVGSDPARAGLALAVVADTASLAAYQAGKAHLVVRNIGATRFAIDSGIPIVGVLVTPGTNHVVGRTVGAIAGVGGGVDLAPGEEGSIPITFGGGRCDGHAGSAVPPGVYGLRVALTAEGPSDEVRPIYLSPET